MTCVPVHHQRELAEAEVPTLIERQPVPTIRRGAPGVTDVRA